MENTNNVVNERVSALLYSVHIIAFVGTNQFNLSQLVSKLSIATPEAFLVERYLEEIAKAYSVDWRSPDSYGGSDDGGDEDVFEVCT